MKISGNFLLELLEWVGKLGRLGGALLVLLGAGFGVMAYVVSAQGVEGRYEETFVHFPALWLFCGFLVLGGAWLLVTGGSRSERSSRFAPMDDHTLSIALRDLRTPFCLCCDCRTVIPVEVALGRCPRCESSSACLEIRSESDRSMALDSVGLTPPKGD